MNVKQGDIARVVGADFERDDGLIVEVIKLAPAHFWDDGPEWECKPCYPCIGHEYNVLLDTVGEEELSMDNTDIPDAWLRPIRPEADPVTTDVVAGVEA